MGSDIFLSYSRADRALAEQFVEAATRRGIDVWFDEKIGGGDDWRGAIVDKLSSSNALVILFSEHSNSSTQLIKELAIADNMKKRVIPVLVADTEPKGPYLYELASRNWINIHPNPDTRLATLIDTLLPQLELSAGSPPDAGATAADPPKDAAPLTLIAPETAPSRVEVEPAAAQVRAASSAPVVRPGSAAAAPGGDGSWFPLKRRDVWILALILAASFLIGVWNKDPSVSSRGLGLSVTAFSIYMIVIAIRNARLNRGVFSKASFGGYFAIGAIGISPVLVDADFKGDLPTALMGLILWSLFVAVAANVLQVILRKIFMQSEFRSKVATPLAR